MASLFCVSSSLHRWRKTVHSKDGGAAYLAEGPALRSAPTTRE